MARVSALAIFLALIPGILTAQGHGATPAGAGGAVPLGVGRGSFSVTPHINGGGSALGGAHLPGSSRSHPATYRSNRGQTMARRTVVGPEMPGLIHGNAGGTTTHRRELGVAPGRIGVSEASPEFDSTPGLGFDYTHLAATHPNGVNGAHRRNDLDNGGAVLFPFSGGGYFLPADLGAAGVESAQAEEAAPEEAQDDGEPVPKPERRARVFSVHRLPALEPPGPQGDVPEYVFVRRDGTLFFAVAYSWENEMLQYVSSEGLRRSLEREMLDMDATREFNAQRGMTFKSPA